MTIVRAFADFLQAQGIATFGQDLYINQVPDDAPDTTYWITSSGGTPIQKLRTGETVKQYFVTINYRSMQGSVIDEDLFALEEMLNCSHCVELSGFEVLEIEANQFPQDSDIDNEDRRQGFIETNIKTYKKEC